MNDELALDPSRTMASHPCSSVVAGSPEFDATSSPDVVAGQVPTTVLARWQQAVHARGVRAAAAALGGDFALGVVDADGRTASLAVDRFAIRTLCHRVVDGRLQIAERADVLAGPSPELDLQALFDYLYFHAIPSPRTIYAGVHRLPPGHFAKFEDGKLRVAPYWRATFDEPSSVSFEALAPEFRRLVGQAVRRQLSGGKAACFLSGGTDSSTVAGMIGRAGGSPAATYSIGFEAEGYDEMAYARIAARHFGTEHHEYYVTPDDLVRSIAEVAASYDQPFGNSSALPAYYCARMARADGVTKLLAGDGGDELFGGNSRYATQRIFDAYGTLPEPVRQGFVEPVLGVAALRNLTLWRRGSSYVAQAKMPMPDRLQLHNVLLRLGVERVLTPAFLARVDVGDPSRQQRSVWDAASTSSQLNRMLAYDWRYTLAENDLPKVRGTAALAGVEVGFPFLDRDLLEFSMQLPARYKLNGGKLRWFFKQALRDFLPAPIISKRKQGFGLPFGVWCVRHPALNRLAADSLESLAARGIVRPPFIRDLLRTHLPEHPGYYGEMVWILMTLEHWLQRHAPGFELHD